MAVVAVYTRIREAKPTANAVMTTELFLPRAKGADPAKIEQFLSQSHQLGTIHVRFEEDTKLPPFARTFHRPFWGLDWGLGGKGDNRLTAESISRRILGEYRDNPGTAYSGARISIKPKT